jgi:hypothetical protein
LAIADLQPALSELPASPEILHAMFSPTPAETAALVS